MYKSNILKLFFINLIFFFLLSCSFQPAKIKEGIANLEQKNSLLSKNSSNKNDVIKVLGETILKEFPNDNIWIYTETDRVNNFYGKAKIVKNNILILEFDPKGILINKVFLTEKEFNKLEFDEDYTKSYAINDTFSKKFLASLRKRFQNKTNSQANYK